MDATARIDRASLHLRRRAVPSVTAAVTAAPKGRQPGVGDQVDHRGDASGKIVEDRRDRQGRLGQSSS
jgi:hypothetical protein